MRLAPSLVALGLPCFVSCAEDQAPGEESDADTDTDTDTDTDADTDVNEAGDDIASATMIAYSDHKTPAASDAIGTSGDRDYFGLTMKAGETVMAYTRAYAIDGDSDPDTVLRVLDADGNLLAENDDTPTRLEETDSALYFQALDAGTYYFEVLDWSDWDPTSTGPEGGSDWTYDLYADPLGVQDDEPNDTEKDADALFDKAGGSLLYANWIDSSNTYAVDFYGVTNSDKDVDMWRVDIADDPGFLTVVLYPGSRPWADLEVSMYDDNGNLLATTDAPEFTSHRVVFEDAAIIHYAEPGTYYFAMRDRKGSTGTTYAGMFLSYLESNSEFESESNDAVVDASAVTMDNSNGNFPDNYYGTMTGTVGAGADSVDCYSVSAADVGGSLDGIYFSAQTQAMEVGSLLDPEITIYGDDGTTVLASATDSAQWDSPDAGVTDLEIPDDQDAVYVCVEAQSSDALEDANQYELAFIAAPDRVFE